MTNQQWFICIKNQESKVCLYWSGRSPILLRMEPWKRTGKFRHFKFEAKWLLQDSFKQLVQRTWKRYITRSIAYQLA